MAGLEVRSLSTSERFGEDSRFSEVAHEHRCISDRIAGGLWRARVIFVCPLLFLKDSYGPSLPALPVSVLLWSYVGGVSTDIREPFSVLPSGRISVFLALVT